MNDDLIRDQLLTMLIAGHDTSTALLAWIFYLLGSTPRPWPRCRPRWTPCIDRQQEPPSVEQLAATDLHSTW